MRALAEVPAGARVVIDASRSMSIDHDVFEILQDFRQRAVVENIDVTFEGLDGLRRDNDAMHRISREFAADTENNPSGSNPVSGRPIGV
jgi:hypothetical protein